MTVSTDPVSPPGQGRGDAARPIVITAVAVASLLCLAVPATSGGRPEIFGLIFLSWSAGYLVAGAIGWLVRPDNRTGPLLLVIGLAGAMLLLGRLSVPWIGIVTQAAATLATTLLLLLLAIAPAGRVTSRLDAAGFGLVTSIYLVAVVVRPPALATVTGQVLLLMSVGLLMLVVRRYLTASRATRRALAPVAAAGVITALGFALNSLAGIFAIPNEPGSVVFFVDAFGRAVVPFGFLVGLLRLGMARASIADLVVELGDLPDPRRLRDGLAAALRDDTLEVGYWSPAAEGYVDGDGAIVGLPGEGGRRAATRIDHGATPVAVIIHDRSIADDPGLVAAVGAATRLIIDNSRLTTTVEEQLAEVSASRARIVEAGDAERRRVERDLHDGAQQQLVTVSLALRLARMRVGEDADPAVLTSLDEAAAAAKSALAELRALARGIYSAVLTEAGLGAAIQSLADRSAVPVDVTGATAERFSAAVERTAYFVVSEALANVNKYANATQVHVTIERGVEVLTVEVSDDGIGDADPARGSGLNGLIDRLSAIDGALNVVSPRGIGTTLRASIPLT